MTGMLAGFNDVDVPNPGPCECNLVVSVEELLFVPRLHLETHGIERSHDLPLSLMRRERLLIALLSSAKARKACCTRRADPSQNDATAREGSAFQATSTGIRPDHA